MTHEEFNFFLLGSAGLCALMAVFNLFRAKKKGPSGYLLSGAFLAVGGALMLYRQGFGMPVVGTVGVVAFVLLVADFMLRAKNQVLERNDK